MFSNWKGCDFKMRGVFLAMTQQKEKKRSASAYIRQIAGGGSHFVPCHNVEESDHFGAKCRFFGEKEDTLLLVKDGEGLVEG